MFQTNDYNNYSGGIKACHVGFGLRLSARFDVEFMISDAVCSGRNLTVFRINVLPPCSG